MALQLATAEVTPLMPESGAALTQLRAYLARTSLAADSRLPPERTLSRALGVTLSDLSQDVR